MAVCNVGSRRHLRFDLRNDDVRQHRDKLGDDWQSDGSNQLYVFAVCIHSWSELEKQYGVVCRWDR
jgi:hypothetical protein